MVKDFTTIIPGAVGSPLLPDQVQPRLPQLPLRLRDIQPPAALWVDANDILLLSCRNSLAGAQVQVSARLMEPDGRIITPQFTLSPTSDRTINTATQALYEGYLLSAAVAAIGATVPTRGQTYCVLKVNRMPAPSNLIHYILGADYLSGSFALEWPYGRVAESLAGQGVMRSIAVTTPAAGAEWSQTVPTNARWRVRAVREHLVTSAAVANRNPSLQLLDPVNRLYTVSQNLAIVAGSTVDVNWWAGFPATTLSAIDNIGPFPAEVFLLGGMIVSSLTINIQAADQYSAVRLYVEEWLED